MIEHLRIRDLGVIADATLELGPGFTAITGETGAGKTMVVTALDLLRGERADAGAVRAGADAARVGGLIRTTDAAVAELVDAAGGEIEDGDLTLTRTVGAQGRSRAGVGGSAAPVGTLGRIAPHLFTVHGQSEQLRLRSATAQREMLDRFGGAAVLQLREEHRRAHRDRVAVHAELAELTEARAERRQEAERLRQELEAIAAVDPQPGEDEELRAIIAHLTTLEERRAATAAAATALGGEGDEAFAADAGSLVETAARELDSVAAHDPRLAELADTLRGVASALADGVRELARYASELDEEGPGELARANARLAEITALVRAYPGGIEEVRERSASGIARLTEIDGDDDRLEQLRETCAAAEATERELAERLTAARTEAAQQLSDRVTAELRELAFPDARLDVRVEPAAPTADGADAVQLLLHPHAGAPARPVAKGASGGELSRVMLAIEVVVAAADPVPTYVFDEVDAGVGGSAAIEIGRRLARLSQSAQVIVVTHLAQVAAFATNHVRVVKDSTGGFTESSCQRLDGDARIAEMARLLSGLADSETARAHAVELLALGARR